MNPESTRAAIERVLADCGPVIVACSGGIDSLLLATIAHRRSPSTTVVAHTVTPAVPGEGTGRVVTHAERHGWTLELVRSNEFEDERYLANPTDRCYFCKTNLYAAIAPLRHADIARADAVIVSGANTDDLGEYRPGLDAAAEAGVRHPFVEAGVGKAGIRAVARHLGIVEADLPSSPCLASRLYTGTRVTEARLRSVEAGESVLRAEGFEIVRCRRRDAAAVVELPIGDRHRVTPALLDTVRSAMQAVDPELESLTLDDRPYRPGQAILHVSEGSHARSR